MKYIKQYEKLKSTDDFNPNMTLDDMPKVNDYIICGAKDTYENPGHQQFYDFVNNNIGKIKLISNHKFITRYDNIPKEIKSYFTYNGGNATRFYIPDIKYFSSNEKDLEYIITAKKYNL